MFFEAGAHDAAWMEGEGAHAFGLATRVQREREQDVGRLRLTVGRPAVIVAAFEVGVLEQDVAPLTYLTEWRMRLAERTLREENTPVSVLARLLGYRSESAFSNAFKRVTGNAPKRYRSAVRADGLAR